MLALFHKLELKYRGPWEMVLDIYKRCRGGSQDPREVGEDGAAAYPPVRVCSVCMLVAFVDCNRCFNRSFFVCHVIGS